MVAAVGGDIDLLDGDDPELWLNLLITTHVVFLRGLAGDSYICGCFFCECANYFQVVCERCVVWVVTLPGLESG